MIQTRKYIQKILLVSAFAIVTFRCAWVTDDAYITFRTVDNLIHGYGLTWDTAERVQTYTHPLWLLLFASVYFFTHEAFYSSIFLSLSVSIAGFSVFVFGLASNFRSALIGALLLTSSKAFVDYSTSGLENRFPT